MNDLTFTFISNDKTIYSFSQNPKVGPVLGGPKKFKYTPYLAFAPNGTVEGEPVYANEGLDADFAELQKRNITLKGKIVIMKGLFTSGVSTV